LFIFDKFLSMETVNKEPVLVDIEKVLASKNAALAKALPRFLKNYLKRIIHQDEVNYIISTYKNAWGLEFVKGTLDTIGPVILSKNSENIPQAGRYLFAANHPLGGIDGMVLLQEIGKIHPKVKFIVNDLLMNLDNLKSVFLPVNKHGKQSSDYFRMIDEAYASEIQILYFPAGLCSRKIKGKIVDLEWKKSFIQKAKQHKRDIIPIYVEARNSNFFYNLSNIRKRLGIKANIEMLYLVDEMFNQKGKTIVINFGKPIPYQFFDKRQSDAEWADILKRFVYQLTQNPMISFNDFYENIKHVKN